MVIVVVESIVRLPLASDLPGLAFLVVDLIVVSAIFLVFVVVMTPLLLLMVDMTIFTRKNCPHGLFVAFVSAVVALDAVSAVCVDGVLL